MYKKFIFCKVTVNKQQHRYIGMHKNTIIIRVVNGLAFSMVTVFEDFFLYIIVVHWRYCLSQNTQLRAVEPRQLCSLVARLL
mgnify:CR=1 FL=1